MEKLSTRLCAGGGILLLQPILLVVVALIFQNLERWEGELPLLLADCNGDGVADAIGRRVMNDRLWGGSDFRVIAVDGNNAEILWASERLGKDATTPRGSTALSSPRR